MDTPRLTIELVPSANWRVNARSLLSKAEWDLVRRAIYRRAHFRCEICGGRGGAHPVECHEEWHYDDANHIQRLERLIALCPPCHRVKHLGLAMVEGEGREAMLHLASVNGWTMKTARRYADQAFEIWEERNRHDWQLDVSLLETEAFRNWIAIQNSRSSSP